MSIEKELNAHIWKREENDHYVEPEWCSFRLFEEEHFPAGIYDPACGFGTIPKAAIKFGIEGIGSDLVDRGYDKAWKNNYNFLSESIIGRIENIVTNPPFDLASNFALKALSLAANKVAIIFPVARLNAAHHWIKGTPLKTVWLMTPRPSMPPGYIIARGEKPGGGKMDYCWLVWDQNYKGNPELKWLRRDK